MALLERLSGYGLDPDSGPSKLPAHQFWSAMVELSLGEITVAQLKTFFDLTGDDATDFDWLVGKYQASANKERFVELMHVIFMLGEMGAPRYRTNADLTARINRIG